MKFSREWSMPTSDTFTAEPIGRFVQRYLAESSCSVDPFARNNQWATYRNDLNPATSAEYHMPAVDFLAMLASRDVLCDLALFDPPYSPRQIKDCYSAMGLSCSQLDTQSAKLCADVRNVLSSILLPYAIVLSFGWNSVGMGKKHGFEIIETMLVCHGGAHNDTICIAERRTH